MVWAYYFSIEEKNEIWKWLLFTFPSQSRKLLPSKNEVFQKIAKVFPWIFFIKWKSRNLNSRNFAILETRESFCPRKFLPFKYSGLRLKNTILIKKTCGIRLYQLIIYNCTILFAYIWSLKKVLTTFKNVTYRFIHNFREALAGLFRLAVLDLFIFHWPFELIRISTEPPFEKLKHFG